jgi:hypothetical protein
VISALSISGFRPLIAQESVAASAQIEYIFQQIFTPTGAVIAAGGLIVVVIALLTKRLLWIMALLSLLCVIFQLHPDALTVNILLPPLQSFRFVSKSIAFVLMCIAMLGLLQIPRTPGRPAVGLAAIGLLAFQLLYTIQLMAFTDEGLAKGALGIVSMASMFLVFGLGFGRMVANARNANGVLVIFLLVSVLYVAINVLQLAVDMKGAFVGGRLTGISGNAQALAAFSAIMLLINCYVFQSSPSTKPIKWVSLLLVAALSAMILASGSRTGALSALAGILLMYRSRVARLAALVLVLTITYYVIRSYVSDAGDAAERLLSTENTREQVWSIAVTDFLRSPLFGQFPFLRAGDRLNDVESSFLRALANMGAIGGVIIAIPFVGCLTDAVNAYRHRHTNPETGLLVDLYLGMTAVIFIQNIFDGYVFGYLSLPAMYLYFHFSLGKFLCSQSEVDEDTSGYQEMDEAA